jgi:hypothetical protein
MKFKKTKISLSKVVSVLVVLILVVPVLIVHGSSYFYIDPKYLTSLGLVTVETPR